VVKAVRTRSVEEKLALLGAVPRTSTAEETAAHLRSEWMRWGEIVSATGATLD
jgi:hypothetical protein